MKVMKITPRGYCYGVVDAMVLAQKAAKDKSLPRPVYILGMIVHNAHVTKAFEELGVITLDATGKDRLSLLEEIDGGTVVFTAHGISPAVRQRAKEKGLTLVDATCPDVTKTHELIREKTEQGYDVVYIGKKGHPEPEGAVGVAPQRVYLVESEQEVDALPELSHRLIVTNQTTMSQWDTQNLMERVLKRFPHAEVHNEICMATQTRQEAVAQQAGQADLVLVVGDPRSNNSNRLAQVATEVAGVPARRIADVTEIDPAWFRGIEVVAVTSGASTPTPITKEVIDYVEQFDWNDPATWEIHRTAKSSRLLPTVRQ